MRRRIAGALKQGCPHILAEMFLQHRLDATSLVNFRLLFGRDRVVSLDLLRDRHRHRWKNSGAKRKTILAAATRADWLRLFAITSASVSQARPQEEFERRLTKHLNVAIGERNVRGPEHFGLRSAFVLRLPVRRRVRRRAAVLRGDGLKEIIPAWAGRHRQSTALASGGDRHATPSRAQRGVALARWGMSTASVGEGSE